MPERVAMTMEVAVNLGRWRDMKYDHSRLDPVKYAESVGLILKHFVATITGPNEMAKISQRIVKITLKPPMLPRRQDNTYTLDVYAWSPILSPIVPKGLAGSVPDVDTYRDRCEAYSLLNRLWVVGGETFRYAVTSPVIPHYIPMIYLAGDLALAESGMRLPIAKSVVDPKLPVDWEWFTWACDRIQKFIKEGK